jgi:hypothetical protein
MAFFSKGGQRPRWTVGAVALYAPDGQYINKVGEQAGRQAVVCGDAGRAQLDLLVVDGGKRSR